MMEEQIPAGYEIHRERRITFIVRGGFEDLYNEIPWKRPSQILSRYPLHPIQQGRGRAVIVPLQDEGALFVKKLRHGGLFGNLVKDLFTDKRILRDLINAHSLRLAGFRSPGIIFLIMEKKVGPWYEGYVGEELIENARNLLEMIQQEEWVRIKNKVMKAVASELRELHDKGFYHSDLNAGNILIRERWGPKAPVKKNFASDEGSGGEVNTGPFDIIFIDLDCMKKSEKVSPGRRRSNIFRLFRSLQKYGGRKKHTVEDDLYFLKSYRGEDESMSLHFEKSLPLHRLFLVFHRPYWMLTRKR
jgi:hypothetical protein